MNKIFMSFFNYRELIFEMAKRDLTMLNKGAFLGYAWLILQPFIQTSAYVIIVSFVFRARYSESAGVTDYALYVLGGMVPWQIITKVLSDAPTQLYSRMDLIKQVIYPIETLPMTSLLVNSLGSIVSLTIFILLGISSGIVGWSVLLLPLPLILLVMFVIGISWILSIAGVFLKDLREVVTVVLGITAFMSPVVASPELVGERIWSFVLLNPLSHIIICFRDIYYSQFTPLSWVIFIVLAGCSLLVGGWTISRAKVAINQYL
jgi:lipopolysaccharide transport system permease protein